MLEFRCTLCVPDDCIGSCKYQGFVTRTKIRALQSLFHLISDNDPSTFFAFENKVSRNKVLLTANCVGQFLMFFYIQRIPHVSSFTKKLTFKGRLTALCRSLLQSWNLPNYNSHSEPVLVAFSSYLFNVTYLNIDENDYLFSSLPIKCHIPYYFIKFGHLFLKDWVNLECFIFISDDFN